MIYFDNAATGGFKPRAVTDAATTVIRFLSANPGRSGHRLSVTGAEMVYDCRESIAGFFSTEPERVIFTKNCTEALNVAIFGTLQTGGHIITTVFEHNSVLRPLFTLKQKGLIDLDIAVPTPDKPLLKAIEEKIKPNTYMIIATAVSNVTGYALPLQQIGMLAKTNDLLFLVDGAQGGGHIHLDMKKLNVSLLALAAHKGLYGIMGSGVLLIDDETEVEPLILGGTGSESFNLNQPSPYPERLEAGTINLPAIAALGEGIRFVKNNMNSFSAHLYSATKRLIDKISLIDGISCYSNPNDSGIVSFAFDTIASSEAADILNSDFDVAVRGGLHCAPLIHQHLNTAKEGLVRVSLAVQNSSSEIDYFVNAVEKIAKR